MGDEQREKLIVNNLPQLTKCTVIGTDIVIQLLYAGLIDSTEKHLLLDKHSSNETRALMLYTVTRKKWSYDQFENFKQILRETNNLAAFQILNRNEEETTTKSTIVLSQNKEQVCDQEDKYETIKLSQIKTCKKRDEIDKDTLAYELCECEVKNEDRKVTNKNPKTQRLRKSDSPINIKPQNNDAKEEPKNTAEFREKDEELSEKIVCEMTFGGWDFALNVLWDDLVKEMNKGNSTGPLTVALTEATAREEGGDSSGWKLIRELEDQVKRRRKHKCSRQEQISSHLNSDNSGNNGCAGIGVSSVGLIDWVTEGVQGWRHNATLPPVEALPFLLRYSRNVTPSQLKKILHDNKEELKNEENLMAVLRSLIVLSFIRYPSHERSFFQIAAFLEENIQSIPQQMTLLTRTLLSLDLDSEQNKSEVSHLVKDVSVGEVFIRLIQQTLPLKTTTDMKTWEVVIRDVIKFTPCCDLPSILQKLQEIMISDQKVAENVVTTNGVLDQWKNRFWSKNREKGESCDTCGLRHLMFFYNSVFGSSKCDWMKAQNWTLVRFLPVEISTVLQEEEMNKNYNTRNALLLKLRELLTEFWCKEDLSIVGEIGNSLWYRSEWEWETLLNLIEEGKKALERGTFRSDRDLFTFIAAPLIRTLIKMFGVNWTRTWMSSHRLWEKIPSNVTYAEDTVEALGSLLHSAIEFGELEEVKKRSWPGLIITWRNSEGKNALEVAKLTKDVKDIHRIRHHLNDLVFSIEGT